MNRFHLAPLTGSGLTGNWIATGIELVECSVDVVCWGVPAWWGTDSKALAKSKKKHATLWCFSSDRCHWCVAVSRGMIVDLSLLNPNCMSESTFLDRRCSFNNWCKCLSRTLLTTGRRDIGLKNLTSFLLDSLGIGTTFDSFQSVGICPVSKVVKRR